MLYELLKTIALKNRPATHQPLDVVSKRYKVGLRHIDFNLHINNAVYLTFLERARWDHGRQTGLSSAMVNGRINFIVAGIDIGYIRELRLGTKFDVLTRVAGWDDKYVYLDQRCIVGEKLHATVLVKAAYIQNGKVLAPQKLFDQMPQAPTSPALPQPIEEWRALSQSKRTYNETQP